MCGKRRKRTSFRPAQSPVLILLIARHLVDVSDGFARVAHVPVFEGAPQAGVVAVETHNAWAVIKEVIILGPLAVIAWWARWGRRLPPNSR